ncbi:MAG: hypothetical protein EOO45_10440 [Flavobacterium sp.]|nr:MAG: hypothetical protein EOO45_10440 [Flavobacterium sp.]
MDIKLKLGICELIFGMKQSDVVSKYGNSDRNFKDDEENSIHLYNSRKLRLTFYEEEEMRLGYIISSNPDLELFNSKVIGKSWEEVKEVAKQKGIVSFEKETFDSVDNYFNEDNWIIFQVEFGEVIRVELGATINEKTDEFDWKFKS